MTGREYVMLACEKSTVARPKLLLPISTDDDLTHALLDEEKEEEEEQEEERASEQRKQPSRPGVSRSKLSCQASSGNRQSTSKLGSFE